LPKDTIRWQFIEQQIHTFIKNYGYGEIRTPVFEETGLFIRGVGKDTDVVSKEMYSWTDQGNNNLTLKPELTAPVVRSFIQHKLGRLQPINRLYYIDSLFRRERPQKGRQRQFHQFGIEAFGSEYPEMDVEVISIAYHIYKSLGITELEVKINSIGSAEVRPKYLDKLRSKLNNHTEKLCKTCNHRLSTNALRVFDCKNTNCQFVLDEFAPVISDFLSEDDRNHFDEVLKLLGDLKIPYTLDNKLVRGLDYYTRTTFEITSSALGSQDALCGGGRYDKLVEQLGGDSTPAVGFAAGMERLLIVLENISKPIEMSCDIYMVILGDKALSKALIIAHNLRIDLDLSVITEVSKRSVKAQMKEANRQNAKFAIILGDNEIENGIATIKNMIKGSQEEVKLNKIINYFN
jgi:histidyl-tRNA synthetase